MSFTKHSTLAGLTLAAVLVFMAMTAWAAPPSPEQPALRIDSISQVGAKVTLNDGSVWRIPNMEDQQVVYKNWLPTQPVTLREGALVNLQTGDIIDAANLTKAAHAPVPPPPAPFSQTAVQPAAPAPVPPAAVTGLETRLDRLDDKLEDLVVRLQALELRLQRLERMAGVIQ